MHALTAILGDEAPSRAEIARWIDAGAVVVEANGATKSARAKDVVRARMIVSVTPLAAARTDLVPDAGVAFDVLHVDADLVVLVKPAGLVVHPAAGNETGTLVHGLLARGWFRAEDLAGVIDEADDGGHARPGIVHRLDKGTSGVMVVARTAFAREHLKASFATHAIERAYDAIVVGVAEARTHATLHGRHPTDRKRFTTKVARGRHAVTHIAVTERLEGATLVRCTLETGRTHQIRVHLAESGTPVLGDPVYGRPPRDPRVRALGEALGHQALHARVLGFVHPRTKKTVRFEAPWPADFERALGALRKPEK